ncbi:MAG: BrnA antitoxin family protein [Peptoanaerobacter stomatis]|uniref:BrnA antitoxin family protein n=1 Tax=Peptoanaerobacter stomatis TaxID=796937 RepID=UPI003F9EFA85
MREEYDINNLNPRKNPYTNRIKRQITINLDGEIINYFKEQSENFGIPYQTLINLYLSDCVKSKRELNINWS